MTGILTGSLKHMQPYIKGYVCRRCIYILDHHCFFLGHCVGRKNQKFFLVFCFYAAIGCSIGVYHAFYTLNNYRLFWSKVFCLTNSIFSMHQNHTKGCDFLFSSLLHGDDLSWKSSHSGDILCWLSEFWIWCLPDDLVPLAHWSGQHFPRNHKL